MANAQSFIQPYAQGNSPFNANNGNPNTVYNQKPTGMVNFIPQTGAYIAPQSDAMNNWAVNPVPMGGATTPFWQLPSGTGTSQGPRLTVPPLTVDPNWVPAVTPPPTTLPPGGTGTTTTPVVRGSTIAPTRTDTPWSPLGNRYPNIPRNANYGTGTNTPAAGDGSLGSIAAAVGGSNFHWQEVLDAFLPGDLYDAASGTWDLNNSVAEALNYFVPGLGDAAKWAQNNGLLGQTLQDMAFNESYKQFEARQRNNVANNTTETQNIMDQRVADTIARRAEQRANAFNPGGVGWNPAFSGAGAPLGTTPFDGAGNPLGGDILTRMNNWNTGTVTPSTYTRGGESGGGQWATATGNAFGGLLGHFQGDSGDPRSRFTQAL